MFGFYDFLTLVAAFIQMFGLLVFGIAAGWFTIFAFIRYSWQVQVAAIFGGFLLAAAIADSISPGGVGAFALGFGGALLFWGMLESKKDAEEEKATEEE